MVRARHAVPRPVAIGFGAREDMVGRTIEVDGVMREVIGIMPAGFDLMDRHVELWLPLQLAPAIRQYRESLSLGPGTFEGWRDTDAGRSGARVARRELG